MKKFLFLFLPFEKYKISTKLSKERVLNIIDSAVTSDDPDYYGTTTENGFYIAEKYAKYFFGGSSRNSFVPVADAKIQENDGITNISITIRMHLLISIVFYPIYFISMLAFLVGIIASIVGIAGTIMGTDIMLLDQAPLCLLLFPIMWLVSYFAFKRHSKRLKEKLEYLLIPD